MSDLQGGSAESHGFNDFSSGKSKGLVGWRRRILQYHDDVGSDRHEHTQAASIFSALKIHLVP